MKKISVIIPAYNEEKNLQNGSLDEVDNYLKKQQFPYEVLIVDDGSKDKTVEIVEQQIKGKRNFRLIKNSHGGKALTVMNGLLHSNGEIALFTDMDQATPIEELSKLLPEMEKGSDIVIGSRNRRRGAPISRQIMSKSAVILRSLIVGLPTFHDTQCGFKLFRRKAALDIFSRLKKIHHGFKTIKGSAVTSGFDVELLYIGIKLGYKIHEVPVSWLYVETRRVSPLWDSIEGVLDLFKIKSNIIRGMYSK